MPRNASQKWVKWKDAKWIEESNGAVGFPKTTEQHRKIPIREVQDHVPRNHGIQWSRGYLPWGNLLPLLHAIGLHSEFGGDPNSPIPAPLLQTFCSCANPLTYWRPLPLQPWICPSWEPSQSHGFRLGGYKRGCGSH